MIRLIAIIFGTLLVFCVSAQQGRYNFHQLTSAEGLSQSTNSFLYTDECGYTWISALDGINLFDGKKVQVFKADPNNPFSMKGVNVQSPFFEDKKGNIWFTTNEAINCYQRNEGHFTHDYIGDSINSVYYAFHLEQQQFLWVTNNGFLYRYDIANPAARNNTPVLDSFNAIRCAVSTDASGKVKTIFGAFWNNKPGFEVIELSPSYEVLTRKTWFDKPGNPLDIALTVYQVISEQKDEAWLVTNKGLLHFNVKNPTTRQPISPPSKSSIKSITSFSENLFWVALNDSSVYLFDKKNNQFLPEPVLFFNVDTKSKIKDLSNIFPMRDDILWVSSKGSGIYFSNIANQKFTSLFINNDLEKHAIDHIYQFSNDDVLLSSNKGKAWIFNRNKELIEEKKLPLYFKQITGFDNTIWNISTRGVCQYFKNEDKYLLKYPAKAGDMFNDILDVNHQYMLLATNQGISFYDKHQSIKLPPSYKDFTVKLFMDNRRQVWSASASTELSVWSIEEEGEIPTIHLVKNFPNLGTILHITEDKSRGIIWVGTSKGLVKIDSQTLTKEHITELNGLPNQYIHAIIIDQDNRLWLSTNKGIIQYIPEEEKGRQFMHFTSRDGLSADEYLHSAALYSSQNEIWFGSTKGVDVFDPKQNFQVGKAPMLSISNLQIHDKKWKGKHPISTMNTIQLTHKKNTLTFQLSALEYTDPLRNKFKVFLAYNGVIDSSFLSGNKVTYANLSPGKYLFSFTACNAEGVWQTIKKQLNIIIIPPYYQTWWFRSIITFLILAFVSFASAFYYRYKLSIKELELEKQKREADRQRATLEKNLFLQTERNRIASEMHDELGGGLSTIRNASAKAQRKKNPQDLYEILNRVSQISINLINNMRGIIWAMDTDYDSLKDLVAHIRFYTKEYSDDNDLLVNIAIPDNLPDVMVNGQFRHNISLVVKEALHNIIKHAKATKIDFKLQIEKQLTIIITDNGQGFEPNNVGRFGRGLRNMAKRMKSVKGTIEWSRIDGNGMQVMLSAPLDTKE